MKRQKFSSNVEWWQNILGDFNWDMLFSDVDSRDYEFQIDQYLYPKLKYIDAISGYSKLKSKYTKIQSRESKFNPDWDDDIILNLFDLFGQHLSWSPPYIPKIIKKIKGKKIETSIDAIKKIGLNQFIKKHKVFSYAFTSTTTCKYTIFDKIK